MIAVIQCAATKRPYAGHMRTADGRKVVFVAQPSRAPAETGIVYARPDDDTGDGETWRTKVLRCNEPGRANNLGLLRAVDLYQNPAYHALEAQLGADNVFILSAGWGLIPAGFLTPYYDIT